MQKNNIELKPFVTINLDKFKIPNWEFVEWSKDHLHSDKYWLESNPPRSWDMIKNPYNIPVSKRGKIYIIVSGDLIVDNRSFV